jgi:hypothetical protein
LTQILADDRERPMRFFAHLTDRELKYVAAFAVTLGSHLDTRRPEVGVKRGRAAGGHFPRAVMIREMLDWLDGYLRAPVR